MRSRPSRHLLPCLAPLLLACTAPIAAHEPATAPRPAPPVVVERQVALAPPAPRVAAHPAPAPDLVAAKRRVTDYYQSGRYEGDIRAVTERARRFLAERIARGGDRLAIILDIDETSLSNWPQIQGADFGYVSAAFHAWVEKAEAIAIGPTLDLFNFARANGVEVFFITGRRQREAAATERNLRSAGFGGWAGAYYKPDPCDTCETGYRAEDRYPPLYDKYAALYKSSRRRWIAEQGYTIVLSLGDQQSDLSGGWVEQTFKLPNPFYLVP